MITPTFGQFDTKATPIESISVKDGFEVELLFTVPKERLGSWVNLCLDDKNRIIASDQFGGLYRFEVPAKGKTLKESDVEKVPAIIRAANGLLWAFDSLYVAVNDYEKKMDSGVYRLTDSNGDDQLDKVEKLRTMQARGDHGVHALILSPDKKSIYLITGNNTTPVEANRSRVPMDWGEDHLLPRMPDGGDTIETVSPLPVSFTKYLPMERTGKLYSGYRNIFDGGFNANGELFTYDADMEYDFNTMVSANSILSRVGPCMVGETVPANALNSTPTICPQLLILGLISNRSHFWVRSQVPLQISKSHVYFGLELGENLCRSYETRRKHLYRREGNIYYRQPSTGNGCNYSSWRWLDVLCNRRKKSSIRPLPSQLCW